MDKIAKNTDQLVTLNLNIDGVVIDYSDVIDLQVIFYQKKDDVLSFKSFVNNEVDFVGSPPTQAVTTLNRQSINKVPNGRLYCQVDVYLTNPDFIDGKKLTMTDILIGELIDVA
jgi:hypothetical protein